LSKQVALITWSSQVAVVAAQERLAVAVQEDIAQLIASL
jgi:hypothetical protein